MESKPQAGPVDLVRIRRIVNRINDLAGVIKTESDLALLIGKESDRTAALRKIIDAVGEMRVILRTAQDELAEGTA